MRSLVAAVFGAILLALPGPALAGGTQPPGSGVWYSWLLCAEDEHSTGTIFEIGANERAMHMRYAITPCTPPTPTTAVAVAFYHPDGHAEGKAHPYGPNGFHYFSVPLGALATCLLENNISRLDCYEISWAGSQATVRQRIPTNDPRVLAIPPITLFLTEGDEGDPECPSCV